jgi:secreted PhoX family phosphatase
MKRIYEITGTQLREKASLKVNNTNFKEASELFFVQLDDEHAVDNTGCIFQIVDKNSAADVAENSNALQYESESGTIYNYAEDSADFAEDSEDLDIYSNCKEQAELLADDNL